MKLAPWIVISTLTVGAALAAACGGETPPSNVPANETATAATASALASTAPVDSGPAAVTSAAPATSAGPTASATPAGSDTGAGKHWDDRTRDQQIATMKTVVTPEMGDAFRTYDAKRYAEFNCGTCHGVGARDHSFKMPNPGLPKLSAKKIKALMDKKSPAFKFMAEVVEVKVAAAIGEEPYNPATKKGFGCGACHVMEKD